VVEMNDSMYSWTFFPDPIEIKLRPLFAQIQKSD